MAKRPVFFATDSKAYDNIVITKEIDFKWFPGFAAIQKQKSIKSLHEVIEKNFKSSKVLEISSKSEEPIGVKLSSFNLMIVHKKTNERFTVECAFQSSKVFEYGGPFKDILKKSSIEAKRDPRLRNSGELKYFKFYNTVWGLEPKTLFYDWLYINALSKYPELVKKVVNYNAFTDIEFNPFKSVNCQAKSAALFVSLYNIGLLNKALRSKDDYIEVVSLCSNGLKENKIRNKKATQLKINNL